MNILITGARSGIVGQVINKIKNRYNLYVTVHTSSELKAVKKIYKDYSNIKCLKLDITSDKDVKKLDGLKVDILICNGAVAESGSLIDMPFEKIRYNFEVNFFSNLKLIKRLIIDNDKLKIIVISSLAGKMPMPFLGAYSASKVALTQMMRALNQEVKLTNKKIDICIIEPGLYKTGFNKLAFDKKYDFMDNDSFFKAHIDFIRKTENLYLTLFEKRKLNSIVRKIVQAINSKYPKFYYRAPISQSLFVKVLNFFN